MSLRAQAPSLFLFPILSCCPHGCKMAAVHPGVKSILQAGRKEAGKQEGAECLLRLSFQVLVSNCILLGVAAKTFSL